MDNVVRNVRDIDSADRYALEHLLGLHLRDDQQVVIGVVAADPRIPQTPSAAPAALSLPDWCRVYEGLSDKDIADVEAIALTRANLSRPSSTF